MNSLARAYINGEGRKGFAKRIDPTQYYVKHYLAVQELYRDLATASFEDRSDINQALTIAQRKMNFFYKKDEFDLKRASTIISTMRMAKVI